MSNILDEIPYIVTPRKDTGLFNSKIAIWLFLASEVMLFGGLFSGYIFLRIYADYPWPERALPVMPGFINTFVLIGSSVTVVFAWASLKMRKYFQFQVYMGITLLCALGFMVLKTMEYSAKFAHQAVRMEESFAIVEGHFHYPEGDEDHADASAEPKVIMAAAGGGDHGSASDSHAGGHHDPNIINFETESVNITLKRFHKPYIKDILHQAEAQGATFTLLGSDKPLTIDYLNDQRSILLKIQKKNAKLRTAALRKAWEDAREKHSELNSRELAPLVKVDTEALDPHLTKEITAFTFLASKPVTLKFDPGKILEGKEKATLHDDTILSGKLLSSPYTLNVDTIDFRFTAMKAEERHQDPIDVIDNSWIVTHNPQIKQIWEKHKQKTEELRQHLIETRGINKETGEPNQVPNENDLYRITWQEMVTTLGFEEEQPGILEGFTGPDHKKYAFPEVSIPREKVAFESNLTPRWNTYYAIYFLMTGLHGLHVIGGALVLGYFGFCSKKMYQENPEWLANRVEVGGLFWHFVDLVWIFLFPIMYLM